MKIFLVNKRAGMYDKSCLSQLLTEKDFQTHGSSHRLLLVKGKTLELITTKN